MPTEPESVEPVALVCELEINPASGEIVAVRCDLGDLVKALGGASAEAKEQLAVAVAADSDTSMADAPNPGVI